MDGQIVECVIKPTTSSQTEKQARKQACSGSSQFSRAGAGSGAGAGAGTGAGTYCYCVVPWLEVFEGVAGHVLCTLSQLVWTWSQYVSYRRLNTTCIDCFKLIKAPCMCMHTATAINNYSYASLNAHIYLRIHSTHNDIQCKYLWLKWKRKLSLVCMRTIHLSLCTMHRKQCPSVRLWHSWIHTQPSQLRGVGRISFHCHWAVFHLLDYLSIYARYTHKHIYYVHTGTHAHTHNTTDTNPLNADCQCRTKE